MLSVTDEVLRAELAHAEPNNPRQQPNPRDVEHAQLERMQSRSVRSAGLRSKVATSALATMTVPVAHSREPAAIRNDLWRD